MQRGLRRPLASQLLCLLPRGSTSNPGAPAPLEQTTQPPMRTREEMALGIRVAATRQRAVRRRTRHDHPGAVRARFFEGGCAPGRVAGPASSRGHQRSFWICNGSGSAEPIRERPVRGTRRAMKREAPSSRCVRLAPRPAGERISRVPATRPPAAAPRLCPPRQYRACRDGQITAGFERDPRRLLPPRMHTLRRHPPSSTHPRVQRHAV